MGKKAGILLFGEEKSEGAYDQGLKTLGESWEQQMRCTLSTPTTQEQHTQRHILVHISVSLGTGQLNGLTVP